MPSMSNPRPLAGELGQVQPHGATVALQEWIDRIQLGNVVRRPRCKLRQDQLLISTEN